MDEVEKTLIEILEENIPIDIVKYINFVRAPSCGAITTFSGSTRDTFDGKTVVELRYEAYVPMAIRCIQSICSEARQKWDLDLIAVAHRVGSVPVGETSIFIAIWSIHRADALDACEYLIDELNASVPIWKKEVYSNGEVWKENSEFLERMSALDDKSSSTCCRQKMKEAEGHEKKRGCCVAKVRVDEGRALKDSAEI